MVAPTAGEVALAPFPFSNLSQSKARPAVCLADGEALAAGLRGHGLTDVRWHPLTFGIATLYVGTKIGMGPERGMS